MTEQQLKKGLFRLWIVFSVCWVSYHLFKNYDDYVGYIESMERIYANQIANAPEELSELDKEQRRKTGFEYGITKSELKLELEGGIEGWKDAQIESIPDVLGLIFGIPLLLFVPYSILAWILKGFKKSD